MTFIRHFALVLAAVLGLASCGGGDSPPAAATPSPASAAAAALSAAARSHPQSRPRALSAAEAGAVDPLDAANQLMDFAETYYPEYFPGHPDTGSALG